MTFSLLIRMLSHVSRMLDQLSSSAPMRPGRIRGLNGVLGTACVLLAILPPAACAHSSQASGDAAMPSGQRPREPRIEVVDVYRFYALYDRTDGRPTAEQLQHYLDTGTEGLRAFADLRRTTGARIAEAMAKSPDTYADAKRCLEPLPRVRTRVAAALAELGRLYADARFPAVTIAVGRGKPVGIGSHVTGIQIGLEALCATEYLNADIEDRFVHTIAHEFVHVQQAWNTSDLENLTVLETSLLEGAAEFVAERISGNVAYSHLPALVAGREHEIESDFLRDRSLRELSGWVGNGSTERPGELGYWVGYRIAKAYYQHADDKSRAIREILEMRDAEGFLAESGWYPGIAL